MVVAPPVFLAHGGGAPEALTVILPVLIFAGFLYVERRNRRRASEAQPAEAQPADRPAEPAEPAGTEDRPA